MDQQLRLYDWLNDGWENLQVVSISSASLRPLVDEGRFLEGLLYRLNVVHLEATPAAVAERTKPRPSPALDVINRASPSVRPSAQRRSSGSRPFFVRSWIRYGRVWIDRLHLLERRNRP
jgi:transcriptional regulator of acetoin/glycerol metabolism